MSKYYAKMAWTRGDQPFIDNRFSRGHVWEFDGGAFIQASASPHVVPEPMSIEENVDPEEAFVASLSSCHMLFFLFYAAQNEYIVDEYLDDAVGVMEKNEEGKLSITRVVLRPKVEFSGERRPDRHELELLHHQSHESCFIANSVKTRVVVEF